MTAAVALTALHKGGPEFKCQVMLWPVTDANFDTGSYLEYAEGYFLSRAMMQWFWDAYAPNAAQRRRSTPRRCRRRPSSSRAFLPRLSR